MDGKAILSQNDDLAYCVLWPIQ